MNSDDMNPQATSPQSDTLEAALGRHEIELPDDQIARLDDYCRLLWAWNEKLNLTRHTDYEMFVTRDLLDTMQLSALIKSGEEVLDVGAGGGVPGLPLAILRPDVTVSVCDSVVKKSHALDQMVEALNLPVSVFAGRAEDLLEDFRFSTIFARAVGPLWKMLHWFDGRWQNFDRLLAIKGPKWVEERGEARHKGYLRNLELRRLVSYPRPGADHDSVILQVSKPKA